MRLAVSLWDAARAPSRSRAVRQLAQQIAANLTRASALPQPDSLFDDERHEHIALAAPFGYALESAPGLAENLLAMQSSQDAINALIALIDWQPRRYSVAVASALPRQRLVMEIMPSSLADALWLQLAAAIASGADYRECAHCDGYMDERSVRADAKYCGDSCRSRAYINSKRRGTR